MKKQWVVVCAIVGIIVSGVAIGLGVGFGSGTDEAEEPACVNKVNSKCFSKAAVAADDDRCSTIGKEILQAGGSAVDAMIASLACDGVVNPYHSGIGGAAFFIVYEKKGGASFINCREMAPRRATEDMFVGNPEAAQHGPLAIGIPGEVKCFKEAHDRFGKLPWHDIFQPAIQLARNGWQIYNHTHSAMDEKVLQTSTDL